VKKALLASAFVVLAIPAFAQSVASSSVGLTGNQGTMANSMARNGGVAIGGAVSGNYADVLATGTAGRGGVTSQVTGTQIGGTIDGAFTSGRATAVQGGQQSTQVNGVASAFNRHR